MIRGLAGLVFVAASAAACDRFLPQPDDLTLPPIEVIQRAYASHGTRADVRYSGNVVELRVRQPASQLERGGSLWARVGPYIYLFTPGTRDIMSKYPGIAAVRVITRTSAGREIARAMLVNDSLGTLQWRRALNLLGHALRDGSTNPVRLENLVRFGETHTEFRYSREFVPDPTASHSRQPRGAPST
ncbi:MAG: hypothetical protein L0271_01725 [Gemmatimonadetes bacterium]|nr:hypothetical protein [Gemmatimonadota bacterium]